MDFFDRLRRQLGVPDAVRDGNRKSAMAEKVAQQAGVDLPSDADARTRRLAAITAIIDAVVEAAEAGRLDAQFAEYDAPDEVASDIARKPPPGVTDQLNVETTQDIADRLITSLVEYVRKHPFEDDAERLLSALAELLGARRPDGRDGD